jgi:hypothetical protein
VRFVTGQGVPRRGLATGQSGVAAVQFQTGDIVGIGPVIVVQAHVPRP